LEVWSKAKLGLSQNIDFRRLGVFGGAFDPIHYGHLICAEQLREAIGLDMVLFVPCGTPPHKPGYAPASAEHRLAMTRLATADHRRFAVSDMEIARGGVSYTNDTVRHLREAVGGAVELWLLMGLDAYLDLPTWKELDELIAECFFGVAGRPGYTREPVSGLSMKRTRFVDITPVKISSSDIRRRLAKGGSVRYLVPDAVERYITESQPYPQASKG
jgi:nicotinate-nucleotide adenylyltransferase